MQTDKTVHVVDDDEAIRDSLAVLLEAHDLRVLTYPSGIELFAEIGAADPFGCVLSDVRMPGMTGLEVQEKMNALEWRTPLILMTGHGDLPMAVSAMRAGAFDFIEKPFEEASLIGRIKAALALSEERKLNADTLQKVEENLRKLSPRERDVLEQMVEGHPNKIIAYNLGISARTVEVHRARVMEKMLAQNLSQLVRMALSAGIAS